MKTLPFLCVPLQVGHVPPPLHVPAPFTGSAGLGRVCAGPRQPLTVSPLFFLATSGHGCFHGNSELRLPKPSDSREAQKMLRSFPGLPPPQEATRTPIALTVSRFRVKFLALPWTDTRALHKPLRNVSP